MTSKNTTMAEPDGKAASVKSDSWTSKILIAAGTIGLVLIIGLVAFLVWRFRKKKRNAAGAPKGHRKDRDAGAEPKTLHHPYDQPGSLGKPWATGPLNPPTAVREKDRWDLNSSANSLIYKPAPAFSRAGLSSSPSLLGAMQPQPSRSAFPPPNPMASSSKLDRSALYIDPRESRGTFPLHTRRASIASSSPILPIEGPGLASHAPSVSEHSERRRSSTPSIIEFAEPLVPRTTRLKDPHEGDVHKSSRFSWTTSLAPKTPGDPASRFSIATSTSSVAHYRTVESWVGNQTNRLDEGKFQEYLEREIETSISQKSSNEELPHRQNNGGNDVLNDIHDFMTANEESRKKDSPEAGSDERRRYDSTDWTRGQRRSGRKNQTGAPQARDSSSFMVHPGTKVRTPRVSLIPSEILDSKVGPGAL
jgi:hypothetical protein